MVQSTASSSSTAVEERGKEKEHVPKHIFTKLTKYIFSKTNMPLNLASLLSICSSVPKSTRLNRTCMQANLKAGRQNSSAVQIQRYRFSAVHAWTRIIYTIEAWWNLSGPSIRVWGWVLYQFFSPAFVSDVCIWILYVFTHIDEYIRDGGGYVTVSSHAIRNLKTRSRGGGF